MRAPDGRRWTIKEIVQGKPLGHPTHAMFVHFPIAFYIGALGFDVLSRAGSFSQAPVAATWLILGAFAGSVLAVVTGLADWWGMVPGSKKRRWATRHMLLQFAAAAFFVVNLATRWTHRHQPEADLLWIALGALGVAVLLVGNWLGGVLVHEMGMRVSTGRRTSQAAVTAAAPNAAANGRRKEPALETVANGAQGLLNRTAEPDSSSAGSRRN
ncbi:MAG: DUF2231 domain-containing protein [Actinomycetota bacterium]